MSEDFLYYLANTAMRGGVIILALLILEFFLRRKLIFAGGRKVFFFALLLVLAPFEQIEFPRIAESAPVHRIEVPDWNIALISPVPQEMKPTAPQPVPSAPTVGAVPAPVSAAAPAQTVGWRWKLADVLVIFYLMGVLLLLARQWKHYFIWRNRVCQCLAITDCRVSNVFLEAKRLTSLERFPIKLLDCSGMLPVAASFGTLRRGAVLCPLRRYDGYTDFELRMILIHELEHLRRRDNPVAFFLTMLSNIFFLNPFVRILASRWAMIAEFDCDGKVRAALCLDRREMAQYAGLLLSNQTGAYGHAPGCGLGASAKNLKLRIQEFAMKRTKLQLSCYFAGICVLFALGILFLPELRADTRIPLDPVVVKNLPAQTRSVVYFNAAALDEEAAKLLDAAWSSLGGADWTWLEPIALMGASVENKGCFYIASVPKIGRFTLLKNGKNPDEMLFWPAGSSAGKMVVQKLPENGYFSMFLAGHPLPAMGLPRELQQKIAATPDEILKVCSQENRPYLLRVVRRDGAYMFSAILLQKTGEAALTLDAIAEKAAAILPGKEQEERKRFVKRNLKFTEKKINGQAMYELEFPLNKETLTSLGDYIRKEREDQERANSPRVVLLSPGNGATNVDPNLKEIKVTFDRPMNKGGWSFCQKSEVDFPTISGTPSYDESGMVITLPVRLSPGKTYNIYLNSPAFSGFRSAQGHVLQPVHYTFATAE